MRSENSRTVKGASGHIQNLPSAALAGEALSFDSVGKLPPYLERHYWWAYVHPNAVRVFERQWLVNAILWGNFRRLREEAINALTNPVMGRTLQVACVYGNFTERLLERHAADATLDVADVLPIQLENLKKKLGSGDQLGLLHRDASDLRQPDAWYDQVVVFFLLHEIPLETRKRTIAEVLRVLKPGGRAVFVDYHAPCYWNPIGLLMRPVLTVLEPFALDLWNHEITEWFPVEAPACTVEKTVYFGGLYQRVTVRRI